MLGVRRPRSPLVRLGLLSTAAVLLVTSLFQSEGGDGQPKGATLRRFLQPGCRPGGDNQDWARSSVAAAHHATKWWLYGNGSGPSGGGDANTTCTSLKGIPYDARCAFVQANCTSVGNLVDYLAFHYCTMRGLQPLSFVILFAWLLLLISLLATTADFWFVPPLMYLSSVLNLSNDVAGITLLALGNGAPDIFGAVAGIDRAGDFPLVVGALLGASIFITTVVLASVILVSKEKHGGPQVDKPAFLRDVVAYVVATIAIFTIARDGVIHLGEALSLLVLYVVYVTSVVALSRCCGHRAANTTACASGAVVVAEPDPVRRDKAGNDETTPLVPVAASPNGSTPSAPASLQSMDMELDTSTATLHPLVQLHWPTDGNVLEKAQYIVEMPFSVLRWLTIPPCDNHWNGARRVFMLVSLPLCGLVFLLDGEGWTGFTEHAGALPIWAVVVIVGGAIGIILFLCSNSDAKPGFYPLLSLLGFAVTIAWMDVQANEMVAELESLGLVFGVNTTILGLTVLAIGNSVGDLICDMGAAKEGAPKMGIASCYGSPLLNDVIGLGLSLTVTTVKHPLRAVLNTQLYVGWGFLAASLVSALIVFPLYQFRAPKWLSAWLYILYAGFMVTSVILVV